MFMYYVSYQTYQRTFMCSVLQCRILPLLSWKWNVWKPKSLFCIPFHDLGIYCYKKEMKTYWCPLSKICLKANHDVYQRPRKNERNVWMYFSQACKTFLEFCASKNAIKLSCSYKLPWWKNMRVLYCSSQIRATRDFRQYQSKLP